MPQLYLSRVVGDGTPSTKPGGNPYRPHIFDLAVTSAQVLELPSNVDGSPVKGWVLCLVDATDFTVIDADTDVLGLADFNLGLDSTLTGKQVNKINTFAPKLGITARSPTRCWPNSARP